MIRITRKYLQCLLLMILLDITNSHNNDSSIEGQRHGRVSGRIVKLYSGPKPDPILCTSEGFLADNVDCSIFYRCLKATNGKYTVYRFQCGPGTVYDPDTEICNHPRSTKRLACRGLSSDKLISTTEKYIENEIDGLYKENPELPSPITTKPPEISNSLLNTIETPKPVNLDSSYITNYPWLSSSKDVNSETTVSTASPWNIQTALSSKKPWDYTQVTYYVTREPSLPGSVQCTSDGFIGDDVDCRKFYRCINNQRGGFLKYEFSCSETTIWDDDTQGCNHPWAVQRRRCGKGNSYADNSINFAEQITNNEVTPNNIFQHQTQISYGSKVTQIQTQISTGPVIQNQTQISYGDRLNPGNFNVKQNQTQINYGAPVSQSQTQFNYGNEVTPPYLQVDYPNHSSQTQAPISDNMLSSTTVTTSISYNKGMSNNKCTAEGFMGDANDCKKFYRCVSNDKGYTMYEFSCNEGTLWDRKLETCNHAWAVKECGGNNNSQKMSPSTAIIENTTHNNNNNAHYTTTSPSFDSNEIDEIGYVSQSNQQEVETTSSTVTQATVLSTATIDSSTPYESTDCKSSGFFGNKNDCTKFHRCVENSGGKFTKYEYKCGDGTVWDPEIESCNHVWAVKSCGTNRNNDTQNENIAGPSNVGNTIVTTVSLIQTTTQKNIPDHDYDSGYQVQQSERPSQPATTTERVANHGDECKTTGFMGDSDCKKFYRCVENGQGGYTRYEFTCGEGTVWDPDIEACNHAWAVKTCGGSSIQNNPTTPLPSVSQGDSDKDISNNTNQGNDKDSEDTIKTTTPSSTTNYITPATNKANDCKNNGFMGNDNDCKIFYRCVENGNGGFIRYEFSCGDGTVWDPKIEACNHVWAVEKCGGSSSIHEQLSSSTEQPNFTTASIVYETSTQHTTLSSSSTIITSTISDSNNQCTSNGFMGDRHDCKKFYRCVEDGKGNYIRYEFSCGDGTVWDSTIQACNHPGAVKSCGSNQSPDLENVSTSRSTTMNDEDTSNNHVTQSNQEIINSTDNNSWSSSTIKSTTMGHVIECNTDGFMGDSNDCQKFYRCVNDGKGNFIRYEFSCGDGTVWDSEINSCNHIHSVKSPCSSMTTQTNVEKEPNYTVSSSSPVTNDYSTTTKEPSKYYQCEQEGFIGDKYDCKKFYRCTDNGEGGFHKYEFTCGEGTVWDQEILACNHGSSNLHCSSMDKQPQTDNSDVNSTTISTSSSQSTGTTQTSSSNDECISEGFYANTNDCKKFFRCVGDGKGSFTKYDFTCGDGTIWVQDIQACDHDSDTSLCSKESVTKTTTAAPSHSSQEKPISTSTIRSTTTDISTTALNTKPAMQDETASSSSSTSETSSTTSSSASTTNQDHCEEAGYFGNSKDCKMFYRCVDDGKGGFTKYDFTCGDGTIWDQDITACNHPQDVSNPSCENKGNSETTTTTTTTKTTTTTTVTNETSKPTKGTSPTESTTTQSNNQNNQDGSTKAPSSGNYTCNEAGYYADPYDCKKFYRCVDWGGDGKSFSIYHFDCGEGTIWDPKLQTCNHEESVYPPRDCSATQSQNESTTATTTTAKQQETTESSTTEGSTSTTQSTTEQSTTQSSTTSEQTTSIQSSTQPSTTEQSTTQKSTTEQSTTQQSTTEQSTTEKSTTEQSTTQQSTTEQSTTEKSTTEQSTTQQSTTEQSTTQKSTTEQSTTQQSTTEQSTTQKATTEQSTTQQSSTEQSTTEESTTQESTTASEQTTAQQSSTTQQSTTSEQTTTTTEQTTTTSNEDTTTTPAQTTTTESTTSTTDQTTKAEQSTTQESTESSSENQSSTTEQSTTQEATEGSSTTEGGQDTTTEQESSNKECPQTDDDQYTFVCPTGFKRHPKYCNLFYQCTEDDDSHEMKVAVFHCPNNTIYDESKTQCVEEDKADKKCDGQVAQKRRVKRLDANYKDPIIVGKEQYLCPAVGHFPFEKNEECSPVLFKCHASKSGKLRGFIYQCPEGYVYWSISRRCEPVNTMIQCRRSLSNWSGRYEIPIERNNVARKAIK